MPAAVVTSTNWGDAAPPTRASIASAMATRLTAYHDRRGILVPTRIRGPGRKARRRRRRTEAVLVDLLSLVVVFSMELPIRPGDRLRRLVGFEPFVERPLSRRLC